MISQRIGIFISLLLAAAIMSLPAADAENTHGHHADKEETSPRAQEGRITAESGGDIYRLAVIERAAGFTLTDLNGRTVSLGDLGSGIKIISFIYTSCPDTCPIATGMLSRLQDILKKEGLLGESVGIVSISIDPGRDTPERLKEYAKGFGADSEDWLFLRGTEEQTRAVLSGYDIWTKKLEDGRIDHVMRVYLVDGEDRVREIYNLALFQPELVVKDIEMLLNEKVSAY